MSDEMKKKPTEKEIQKVEMNMPGAKSDKPAVSISTTEDGIVSASMEMPEFGSEEGGMVFGAGEKNVTASFKGLPISELIAAPFTAACDAQLKLLG